MTRTLLRPAEAASGPKQSLLGVVEWKAMYGKHVGCPS
eukprot:CAMPEP_0195606836 /NCGR_PEP_ID=MMETSP0815-20121206/7896_1 /TAXON_ID=97485 /ORGANISM="Prymnesium parvum, Strain Texoma1" /LENGTH=37 /DNA_ID= /DNA_START= /DNA_END= /DNA_ORIENTATION=